MVKGYHSLNNFFSKNSFIGSFNEINFVPFTNFPECCFIGRSNVGKSSLINAITKTKKLAKTSKKPGRTQSINLYKINDKINLVDLPGYGYGKISQVLKIQLANLILEYIEKRKNLKKTYILIDTKVGIKQIDLIALDKIFETNRKFSIVLTKTDNCSKKLIINQKESIQSLINSYSKKLNTIIATSSKTNEGISDVQKDIYKLIKN